MAAHEQTPLVTPNEDRFSITKENFSHGNRLSYRPRRSTATGSTQASGKELLEWPDDAEGDSDFSALMNLVTGAIGSGVVYLPSAAGMCGVGVGMGLIVLMGLVSAHSTTIVGTILLMARSLGHREGKKNLAETFEDMARVIWGKVGYIFLMIMNYLDLYLTVAVFAGTLVDTCNKTFAHMMGGEKAGWEVSNSWMYIGLALSCIPLLPLCYLKTMDALSKFSVVAVAANFIILFCIAYSAFTRTDAIDNSVAEWHTWAQDDTKCTGGARRHCDKIIDLYPDGKIQWDYWNPQYMWGAYGNFGFAYAVACVTPSLVMGMKKPGNLGKVVWGSHVIIIAIYCLIMFVSWYGWGNGIAEASLDSKGQVSFGDSNIIDDAFMESAWCFYLAAFCLAISIISSIPLFMAPISELSEDLFKKTWPNISELAIRIVNRTTVLLACFVPIVVFNFDYPDNPKLSDLQGFTGAVTTTTICSVFPNLAFFFMTRMFPKGHQFRSGNMGFMLICGFCFLVGLFTAVVGFLADGMQLFDGPTVFK